MSWSALHVGVQRDSGCAAELREGAPALATNVLVVVSILVAWAFAVSDTVDVAAAGTEAIANLTLSEVLGGTAIKVFEASS